MGELGDPQGREPCEKLSRSGSSPDRRISIGTMYIELRRFNMPYTSPIWKVSDDEFSRIISSSKTYTEILEKFGLKNRGSNHKTVKKRIALLGLRFNSRGYNKALSDFRKKPLSHYLKTGSIVSNTYLKKRLINEGVLEEKCAVCGLAPMWNGRHLSLHLDHKNGDPTDNELKNIRLVCPNCHSQTDNYCGKSKKLPPVLCKKCGHAISRWAKTGLCSTCHNKAPKKSSKPGKEELEKLLDIMPATSIGKKFGVTGGAVKKWIKSYNLQVKFGVGDWSKFRKIMPCEEELKKLNNLPAHEISIIYGVHEDTVNVWFKKYKIKRPDGVIWAKKRWNKASLIQG